LQSAKLEGGKAMEAFFKSTAATDMDGLNKDVAAVRQEIALAGKATRQASTAAAALGLSVEDLASAEDRSAKALTQAVDIVAEGGNIEATTLSMTKGQEAGVAILAAANDYTESIKKGMSDEAAIAASQASQAKAILISAVVASLAIGVASALWIALNIGRGLSRAVGLAQSATLADPSTPPATTKSATSSKLSM